MPEISLRQGGIAESERYFRAKVNMPTQRWDDLWQGQHARAFVSAGVARDAVLTDLHGSVDAAISKGETLADFKGRFDDIISRHGWIGGAGNESAKRQAWRARVIYDTNIRTAYMAGRWDTLKTFPYLRYKHNSVINPREQHKAWDGLTLRTDDPWWLIYYPQNGWFCHCSAIGVSEARLRAEGRSPDVAPAGSPDDPPPEWRYHVGHAASGRYLSEKEMQFWRDEKRDAWEVLTPKSAAEYGRPDSVPFDPLPRPLATERYAEGDAMRQLLRGALGGEERVFKLAVSDSFSYSVVASVETLADHIDPVRARVVPLLPDVLAEPFEVWQSFERHIGTGRVALRTRYIRAFAMPDKPGYLVVVEVVKGQLVSWTLVPTRAGYLQRQRYGHLLYGR